MMKKLIVNKGHRVAKLGDPSEPQAVFRKGECSLDEHPRWAVRHMVEKGLAEVVEVKKADPDPDEAAAKAKAEAEAAARAKAEAEAAAKAKGK